jgi:glucoamylase
MTYVTTHLYSPNHIRLQTAVIKSDLEYVALRWDDHPLGFDLWEEVRGTHFFTLRVSYLALMHGAELADKLADPFAARYYREQANRIDKELRRFWDHRGYIRATLEEVRLEDPSPDEQKPTKVRTSLDCAVPLAIMHGTSPRFANSSFGDAGSDRVLASVREYAQSFDDLYQINRKRGTWAQGRAVGRYAEDVYDGVGRSKANPWCAQD